MNYTEIHYQRVTICQLTDFIRFLKFAFTDEIGKLTNRNPLIMNFSVIH